MAKHLVTFNGENESGHVTIAKTVFPSGEAVEVDGDVIGQVALGRLQNHPEFTVVVAKAKPAKAPPNPAASKPRTKAKTAK